jgi:hypothetical protein
LFAQASIDVQAEGGSIFEVSERGSGNGEGPVDADAAVLKALREEVEHEFAHRLHALMLLEALVLGTITCTYSTELLGVFFAGFNFSTRNDVREAFELESLPVMKWLGMAFFASLGFSIPLEEMLSWKMFGSGLVMTIPAVFGACCVLRAACCVRCPSVLASQLQ